MHCVQQGRESASHAERIAVLQVKALFKKLQIDFQAVDLDEIREQTLLLCSFACQMLLNPLNIMQFKRKRGRMPHIVSFKLKIGPRAKSYGLEHLSISKQITTINFKSWKDTKEILPADL